jgi:DNA polymerase-1
MIRMYNDKKLMELQCDMLLQVHDELVIELPEENAEEAVPIITRYMTEVPGFSDQISVPIECSLNIADYWCK